MANKPTATVQSLWADAGGRLIRLSFNIELKTTVIGNFDLNAMAADAREVLEKIDALSECELLGAFLSFPLPMDPSVLRQQPLAESSARRGAVAYFLGSPGENQRSEIVSVLVPDPQDDALDKTGRIIRLKTDHTGVQNFVSDFVGHARTSYGETIASFKSSIYRQRAVTKRSKQLA